MSDIYVYKIYVPNTVQFPNLVTYKVRKWGETKEKGGAGYKAITCFMARDISEKYQSQIHLPLEPLKLSVASNVSDKCFFTDSSC